MNLTADFLFQGAVFASEQAGILLYDGIELFKKKRYSSSMILGVYSREEIGRARILLEQWNNVTCGQVVTDKNLKVLIGDHLSKLKAGQFAISAKSFRAPKRELTKLSAEQVGRPWLVPRDAEHYKELHRRMEGAASRVARSLHKQRLLSIYVGISGDNKAWNRPCRANRSEAHALLYYLSMDYMFLYFSFRSDEEASMVKAFVAWRERPDLLKPIFVDP
jgi:AbiV family abortive infection protein